MKKDSVFTRTISHATLGSVEISAEISPCVWMYNSDFQLTVKLPNGGGDQIIRRRGLKMDEATQEHVDEMLSSFGVTPCIQDGCNNPAFDPIDFPLGNRKGVCEQCFMAAMRERLAASQEAEKKKLAEEDAQAKAEGYTHRVDMVVHPAEGDDKFLRGWYVNPTPKQIQTSLRRRRSTNVDDFVIIPL